MEGVGGWLWVVFGVGIATLEAVKIGGSNGSVDSCLGDYFFQTKLSLVRTFAPSAFPLFHAAWGNKISVSRRSDERGHELLERICVIQVFTPRYSFPSPRSRITFLLLPGLNQIPRAHLRIIPSSGTDWSVFSLYSKHPLWHPHSPRTSQIRPWLRILAVYIRSHSQQNPLAVSN